MILNDKQIEAVNCKKNIIRVVAGAGSGKTRVLTERIKRHLAQGIEPSDILAITFTNKAANEMKERVGNNKVNISTIHSLCVKILRQEYYSPNFRIYDTDEQKEVFKEIYEENNLSEKTYKLFDMMNIVLGAKLKRLNEDFEEPEDYPYSIVYKRYIEKLKRANALDFDDLIINTAEILRNKEPRERWSKKYKYILVDEFQDTDNLQYEIIKHLASVNNHLFVVGDGDQMIYSWRGSEERIFNDFDKDFPECETIILNQNYRSTKNILDTANKLIHNNVKRIEKDLFTEAEEGSIIRKVTFFDDKEEAKAIVDEILENRDKYSYSDYAILYRANYMSKPLERALIQYHIPYTIYGAYKFYERKEIKDMLAYLKFIEYKDDLTLKRIINVPARGIGKTKIKMISDIALNKRKTLYEVLRDKDYESKETNEFLDLIKRLEQIDYWDILPVLTEETGYFHTLESEDNVDNVKALIQEVKEYHSSNLQAKLVDYLSEVTLFSDVVKVKDGNSVQLMTIHTSKGLEFTNVYVVGMSEGKFPKSNGYFDEEERRLAYVAYTRAKKNLTLCSEKFVFGERANVSKFVSEVDTHFEDLGSAEKYWY